MTAAFASAVHDIAVLAVLVIVCGALPYGAFRAACWLLGEDED